MRFGFVITNLAGGGAERATLNVAAGLAARGHRSDVVLLENIAAHAAPPGIAIHSLGEPGRAARRGWLGKRLAAYRLARAHARLARAQRFDLIVSTLPFADEVAIAARLPRHWCRIANTLSAEIARLQNASPVKAARRIARYRCLYEGRPLIAVSQGVADDLRERLHFAAARIEVIPNPFDGSALRARAAEPADLPPKPYLIHVGRFTGQKRHDLLLEAFAGLDPRYRLVLLADPAPALGALVAARGLEQRVQVAGFQHNPYPWIAGAELLILSSDHEGLPNVIIEALLLGVPVVSTDCPSGPREILGDALRECLAPVGDAAALRTAIGRALARPPDVSRVDLSRYAAPRVIAAYERLAAEPLEPCAASSA
jgi:glycosyltransferase involved in cell wall biosynthesis